MEKQKAKVKKVKLKTGLKVLVTSTYLFVFPLQGNLNAKATTIDDLRELSGYQRVDSLYTPEQQAKILMEYTLISNHNRVAKMLNASNPIDINKTIKKDKKNLNKRIDLLNQALNTAFERGLSVSDVIKLKTDLGNLVYERDNLAEERPILKMKVKKNPYAKKYRTIVGNIEEVKSYKKIGVVGNNLLSPVKTGFVTLTAFGYRIDANGGYSEHRGVDLKARKGDKVVSAWNGVVSSIKKDKKKGSGYSVTVKHDKELMTVYKHVDKLKVRTGDKLKQYDNIGQVSGNKEKLPSHLHFEVIIDDTPVNPMFFYGNRGYKSLENYIMKTDDILSDAMKELLPRIKKNADSDKSPSLKSNSFDSKDTVKFNRGKSSKSKGSVEVYLDKNYGMPKPKGDFND